MAIGKHLKIKRLGDAVLGVQLLGDPKKPEPIHFRIYLPFGDVDITRTKDNDYWIHISRNGEIAAQNEGKLEGRFIDARLYLNDKHAGQEDIGDFNDPALYHLAVRLGPKEGV